MPQFKKAYVDLSTQQGFMGEKRQKTIDKAFNVIMKFLIPDTFSQAFYLTTLNGESPQYVNMTKLKKIRNFTKYQIQEMFDNHEVDDLDLRWHTMKLTDEQAELYNKHHHIILEGKRRFKEIIVRLSNIRKDIK